MTFTLQETAAKVLASLGMTACIDGRHLPTTLSGDAETLTEMIRGSLPGTTDMIMEASAADIADGILLSPECTPVKMPCGLYATMIPLDPDIIRVCAVKMRGWRREATEIIDTGSAAATRLWSREPGIAGDRLNPAAYLLAGPGGRRLAAMGSTDNSDSLEYLRVWKIPDVTEDGRFSFPALLYPRLIERLADSIRTNQAE